MAITQVLTISEIAAKITDSSLRAYVEDWGALPSGVDVAEFLCKFLQAAYVAQTVKNAANTGATTGENLALISAPVTSTVRTDATNNLLLYTTNFTVSTVSTVGQDITVANYV